MKQRVHVGIAQMREDGKGGGAKVLMQRRGTPMQQYAGRSVIAPWLLHDHGSGIERRCCHPDERSPGVRTRAAETGTHAQSLMSGTDCVHVQTLQHSFDD